MPSSQQHNKLFIVATAARIGNTACAFVAYLLACMPRPAPDPNSIAARAAALAYKIQRDSIIELTKTDRVADSLLNQYNIPH